MKENAVTPFEVLGQHPEPLPPWLQAFDRSGPFRREAFFDSRVVYYPGSGTDGHPVALFGSTHSAHCFVYVDYGLEQTAIVRELAHPSRRFQGYHTFARIHLTESDLSQSLWHPTLEPKDQRKCERGEVTPFAFLEILERDADRGDSHGPSRLAILFLGADGIATYDALFCQENGTPPPFAVVLQDHGFGGNYDRFGQGGLLERIAIRSRTFPEWLLVAQNTRPWTGFLRIRNMDGHPGGMHRCLRFLFQQAESEQAASDRGPDPSGYGLPNV